MSLHAKSPPSSDSTTSFARPIVRSSNAPPPVRWLYVSGADAVRSSETSPPVTPAAVPVSIKPTADRIATNTAPVATGLLTPFRPLVTTSRRRSRADRKLPRIFIALRPFLNVRAGARTRPQPTSIPRRGLSSHDNSLQIPVLGD